MDAKPALLNRYNGHAFTARHLRTQPRGRPPKFWWTDENLEQLRQLVTAGASHDDLQAAFSGLGLTTILLGTRILVQEMSLRLDELNPASHDPARAKPEA